MAKYTPRTTAPSTTNEYFINYSKGGYNTAIVIDQASGSVLPNCVGYAQGRFREICGDQNVWSKIGNNLAGNAETFFNAAKIAGFGTGQTPKLGAIIVWEGVGSTAGHVAIVEEIKANGDIVTSNSAYGGERFYLKELTKASGYLYVTDGSRPLLGFVYQDIDFESSHPEPTKKVIYRVQIGAYTVKSNADKQLAKVKAAGFTDAFIAEINGIYKIQVGAYEVKANAEKMLQKVREAGFSAFITKVII